MSCLGITFTLPLLLASTAAHLPTGSMTQILCIQLNMLAPASLAFLRYKDQNHAMVNIVETFQERIEHRMSE